MNTLKNKLKAYSSLAVATLGCLPIANAQINYKDIPDIELDGMTMKSFEIDLNNDSITDITIYNSRTSSSTNVLSGTSAGGWWKTTTKNITGKLFGDLNDGSFVGYYSSAVPSALKFDEVFKVSYSTTGAGDNILLGKASAVQSIQIAGTGSVIGVNTTNSVVNNTQKNGSGYWQNGADTINAYLGATINFSGEPSVAWFGMKTYDFMKVSIMDYGYTSCDYSSAYMTSPGLKYGAFRGCLDHYVGTDCSNAKPLICGDRIQGTLDSLSGYPDICGFNKPALATAEVSWYTFEGDGAYWEVTASANYGVNGLSDPVIRLFTGNDCSNLLCEEVQDDSDAGGGNLDAQVKIQSIKGVRYYVAVSKYPLLTGTGSFDLTVDGGCLSYPLIEYTECDSAFVNGSLYKSDTIISEPKLDANGNFILDGNTPSLIDTNTLYEYVNAKISIMKNSSACTDTVATTSIELNINSDKKSLHIYPNPSSGLFHMILNNDAEVQAIEVVDAQGRSIFNQPIINQNINQKVSLDLTNHPHGLYFVKVRLKFGYEVYKVIKD